MGWGVKQDFQGCGLTSITINKERGHLKKSIVGKRTFSLEHVVAFVEYAQYLRGSLV